MTLQMTVMQILRMQKQSPKRGLLIKMIKGSKSKLWFGCGSLIKTYTIAVAKKHGQYTNGEVVYPE